MKIRISCPPGYEDIVPKPRLAAGALPDWLAKMPATAPSPTLAGELRCGP